MVRHFAKTRPHEDSDIVYKACAGKLSHGNIIPITQFTCVHHGRLHRSVPLVLFWHLVLRVPVKTAFAVTHLPTFQGHAGMLWCMLSLASVRYVLVLPAR